MTFCPQRKRRCQCPCPGNQRKDNRHNSYTPGRSIVTENFYTENHFYSKHQQYQCSGYGERRNVDIEKLQQGIPCKKESNHDCIRDQSSFPCLHLFSCCIEIDDNRRRTCDINHSKQHHKSGEYLLYTQMQIHLYKLYELYFGVYRPQVILINHETTPKYFLTTAGTANPATIPIFNPPRSLHPKAHGYVPTAEQSG